MTNCLCQKIYHIVECISRHRCDKPPVAANVIFAGACYLLAYPALRRIFRRRFLKRLLKLLIIGLSVGSLLSLLMMLTIAQTKITLCRLLNNGISKRMNVRRIMVYVICFNLIYTYIRSRLLKATVRRISTFVRERMGWVKEEDVFIKEEGKKTKVTRRGTIYG